MKLLHFNVLNMVGRWFSPGPPVSSTNQTDRHDITEILLKVALNTIKPNQNQTLQTIVTNILFYFLLAKG
jgi:hypothetical protein